MAELQIPPSINDSRSQALMVLIERLGAFDLTPLLVYRIDSVPAGALPFLAWQFDILSPLWQTVAPVITSVDTITNVDLLIDIDTLTEAPSVGGMQQSMAIAAERATDKDGDPAASLPRDTMVDQECTGDARLGERFNS